MQPQMLRDTRQSPGYGKPAVLFRGPAESLTTAQSNVEPAYLIYMHFYAATSMELCVRSLPTTSPYRARLLQQARTHYDRAAALVQRAEESVTSKTRPSSVTSTSSSLHSPAGSVSSRAWTSETGISSPTHSICSFEDLTSKSQHARSPSIETLSTPVKKKVSFSLPREIRSEPFIRPDSPTLGFDDEYFTSALARPELPKVPQRPQSPEAAREFDEDEDETTPRAVTRPPNPFDDLGHSFILVGSVNRYCEHLAELKSQLASHSFNLETLLEHPSNDDETSQDWPPLSPTSDEMRSLDRQARIERLRQSGWQRKRFDPSRYEKLRDTVLAELA